MSKLKDRWKEELKNLHKEVSDLLKADPSLKDKKRCHSKIDKEINGLLKLVENISKQTRISDEDVMDILNAIVLLSQMTASQALINIIQRRADYLWELHAEFLKHR